jgi:hypothetical protein
MPALWVDGERQLTRLRLVHLSGLQELGISATDMSDLDAIAPAFAGERRS